MIACPTCGEVYPEADCNVHVCSHSAAQEWQLRIAAAQAGASDVCGSESLHCETARKLRKRVRELEKSADILGQWAKESEAKRQAAVARADKAEAERDQAKKASRYWAGELRASNTERDGLREAIERALDEGCVSGSAQDVLRKALEAGDGLTRTSR